MIRVYQNAVLVTQAVSNKLLLLPCTVLPAAKFSNSDYIADTLKGLG